ncbi:helix-turn-helix domain-containing protein [Wenjunlia tyrosinilytica]|uniref:HTH cro/C1-type domain-containing protein n=1 Tax=Wenjunlia tyrosinilytica TaxID=1544741 RepID=A0A917ZXA7_9ACTN|nr:helix-turn-helix transcriptional regulator [Wenjunlia tyrosinilytica]GGP00198.1 hypothetical protein GCM10012280_68430 [Wenjunlia tyrosinilytica]
MEQRDLQRLGQALKQARKRLDWSQSTVAKQIRVSVAVVSDVENGAERQRVTRTMRDYAELVGWPAGSVESVIAGGEPLEPQTPPRPGPEQAAAIDDLGMRHQLPWGVADEIENGHVLGAQTRRLPSGGLFIAVVVAPPDATTEARRQQHREGIELFDSMDTGPDKPDVAQIPPGSDST